MLTKNRTFTLTWIFALAICIALAAGIQLKQSRKVVAQSETAKLAFDLAVSQNNYVLLEPIPFQFKLANRTNTPITWRGLLMFGSNLDLLIRYENGEEFRWEGQNRFLGSPITGFVTLQSGQEIQRKDMLGGSQILEKVFSRPGKYEVRAEFRYDKNSQSGQRETILSNSVTINIVEPNGVDRQAYNYIKQVVEPARYRERASSELLQLQQNFLDNYGNSVYAKYIAVEVASGYKASGENAKAKKELCKIHDVNFYFSEQVRRSIWEIDAKLNPRVLVELPENAKVPLVPHPCTGRLVNPHAL
ncbi:MAG TPA: hypothetical protein VGB02_05525 [Pyrinomonadaceae bacterium]|jgi:hypothetical protein